MDEEVELIAKNLYTLWQQSYIESFKKSHPNTVIGFTPWEDLDKTLGPHTGGAWRAVARALKER
jgi:hypothetical protein